MSNQTLLIDNIAFAKRNEHLTGTLSLADCPRLPELLESQAPEAGNPANSKNATQGSDIIDFTLDGETNAIGQHFLHLSLRSNLTTFCQRCLEQMPLSLNLDFHYLISEVNTNNPDMLEVEDNDDFDWQEASQAMDVAALIEDEIIMALPIAPTHESKCSQAPMQSGEKPNPFAVLKGLIKS